MEKISKIIRSRYFISAFVIILEFVQLMVIFYLLNKFSIIMTILSYIFYVGVFIYIINKHESPEFKLPWIIIIMLFFILGSFFYVLVSGNEENKKIAKRHKKNKEKVQLYLKLDESLKKIQNENKDAYLQVNYINKSTNLPYYRNTKAKFYKLGETFHKDLLVDLKSAKHFIFMEYFIIEEGNMWNPIYEILKEKVNSNVKVYLIYDDFGCMTTLDERYYKKLNNEGINCIPSNIFRPVMSKIYNNRDHRKITVIDGLIGYTGGVNLADEYINEKQKYGHWKDTAIRLEGEAVKNLTALFLETWNVQNKEQLEVEEFMNIKYKELKTTGIIIPYGDGPEEIYKDTIGKNVYLNMISAAKKYLYITTPYLICDYELLNALCLCAKKGVDVKIITPHIPDKKAVFWMSQSNYKVLVDSGVKIYEYTPGFIHAKEFICDDIYAICGTINLDYRSLVHHYECATWMYNAECISDMKKDFEETLEKSEEIVGKKVKVKGIKKITAEILKIFSPLM